MSIKQDIHLLKLKLPDADYSFLYPHIDQINDDYVLFTIPKGLVDNHKDQILRDFKAASLDEPTEDYDFSPLTGLQILTCYFK